MKMVVMMTIEVIVMMKQKMKIWMVMIVTVVMIKIMNINTQYGQCDDDVNEVFLPGDCRETCSHSDGLTCFTGGCVLSQTA